jgi:hypothetical protein
MTKTEGSVTVYGAGSIIPAIAPAFDEAFPGVKVNDVDATDDAPAARAISESRAGKTLGDVWQTPLDSLVQMNDARVAVAAQRFGGGEISCRPQGLVVGRVRRAIPHHYVEHLDGAFGLRAEVP